MNDQKPTIYFYDNESDKVRKEHIFLNNFDPSPFVDDKNLSYPTVEHYYQAHKFDDFTKHEKFAQIFEEIRTTETPLACKKLARKYEKEYENIWGRDAWEAGKKEAVMKKGLVYKFTQNPDLLQRLMDTGDSALAEASLKDLYWGGLTPGSKNRLGECLMELRENYRKTKTLYFD